MSDSEWYTLNLCLIKVEWDILMFFTCRLIIWSFGFSINGPCGLMLQIRWRKVLNLYRRGISHIILRYRYFCELDMSLFQLGRRSLKITKLFLPKEYNIRWSQICLQRRLNSKFVNVCILLNSNRTRGKKHRRSDGRRGVREEGGKG